jgi:hypothetical protein
MPPYNDDDGIEARRSRRPLQVRANPPASQQAPEDEAPPSPSLLDLLRGASDQDSIPVAGSNSLPPDSGHEVGAGLSTIPGGSRFTRPMPSVQLPGDPQRSFFATPQQAAMAGSQALPSAEQMTGIDPLHPTPVNPQSLPSTVALAKPPFLQAASQTDPQTGMPQSPLLNPALSKLGKLGMILMGGVQGALAGIGNNAQTYAATGRNAGFGGGFEGAQELPFLQALRSQEVQRGALQNQFLPATIGLGIRKTASEIGKNQAEAGKFGAEAGAIPTRQALEQAQTAAARYKESGGVMYDVSGATPKMVAGETAPLDADEAALLGKQAGDRVPVAIKNTANEMKNRGFHAIQANGRSLVVDSRGNTVQDKGAATPLVLQQNQMQPGQITPDMQRAIDLVGSNKVDLQTALGNFRRFPGQAMSFLGALSDQYPNYFQGDFGAAKKVLDYFTSGEGSKNVNAFNTATEHLNQLSTLATALNNKDNQTYNKYKNLVGTWSGQSAPTNFGMVKTAVAGEIGKTFKGQVTDDELKSINANVSNAMSPQQLDGVIQQALGLMKSKMQANVEQYQKGRQGQPAFPMNTDGSHPLDAFWR